MVKVLKFSEMYKASEFMEPMVFEYINNSKTESFESFDRFDFLSFDFYNLQNADADDSKIRIYFDSEDLFFFCEDSDAEKFINETIGNIENEMSNQKLLYTFFGRLFKGDREYLDNFEQSINNAEDDIMDKIDHTVPVRISEWKKELLRLKRYYEQLDTIFDEMAENENGLLEEATLKRISILGARTDRYISAVRNLQEMVAELRDEYQSQLSIEQNEFMKIFTIVTAIFLPLTLITGWYGMNFANMPELSWKYGYPVIILISALLIVCFLWFLKHKKML